MSSFCVLKSVTSFVCVASLQPAPVLSCMSSLQGNGYAARRMGEIVARHHCSSPSRVDLYIHIRMSFTAHPHSSFSREPNKLNGTVVVQKIIKNNVYYFDKSILSSNWFRA